MISVRRLAQATLVTLSICTFVPLHGGVAGAAEVSDRTDDVRLDAGETLRFPLTVDRGGGHYVGGVSYAYLPGTYEQLEAVCEDVDAWKVILPRTKGARVLQRRGDEMYVELVQGNALFEATYTLHVHFDRDAREARFWLVRGRRHDIENAWGFFRFDPAPSTPTSTRTRVTFGVLVDIGAGFLAGMVEPKVQIAVMSVPDRLRDYLARQASR